MGSPALPRPGMSHRCGAGQMLLGSGVSTNHKTLTDDQLFRSGDFGQPIGWKVRFLAEFRRRRISQRSEPATFYPLGAI